MIRYEIDTRYSGLVFRKIRPVWAWERELKWSMPPEGNWACCDYWSQETLGL